MWLALPSIKVRVPRSDGSESDGRTLAWTTVHFTSDSAVVHAQYAVVFVSFGRDGAVEGTKIMDLQSLLKTNPSLILSRTQVLGQTAFMLVQTAIASGSRSLSNSTLPLPVLNSSANPPHLHILANEATLRADTDKREDKKRKI